jgi:insulysin
VNAKPTGDLEKNPTLYCALDIFAQFFIHDQPLFPAETLEGELSVIESEYQRNFRDDERRLNQLKRSLSNPKHPWFKFSTGNLETLKKDGLNIREEIKIFYLAQYSANRMKLIVMGREPLHVLEEWVTQMFAGVINKDLPQNRWDGEEPLGGHELLKVCFAQPVSNINLLTPDFPFLDEELLYKSKPGYYIGNLIGHEAPGSILSYLKSRGWATALSAAAYKLSPGGLFTCEIRLTDEGLNHYRDVVKIFFQYLSLLRETLLQEWFFNELKHMVDINFRFKEDKEDMLGRSFAYEISSVMQEPVPRQ